MARHPLIGSERQPLPGARSVGAADPTERFEVSVLVRRRSGMSLDKVKRRAAGDKTEGRVGREEFARQFGADPGDLAAIKKFATDHGPVLVQEDAARRTVVLSGTVAQFNEAFGVELQRFEHDGGSDRGRTGSIQLPDELRGVVEAVLGLDDRPQARPHFRVRDQGGTAQPRASSTASVSFTPTQLADRGLRQAWISARFRRWVVALGFAAGALSVAPGQAQEMCGGQDYPFPFTDVSGVGAAFCPGIMEAYVTGVSKGTTPTTFSPNNTVTRLQMTTFLQRSLDQGVTRGSRRAALNQWWTPQGALGVRNYVTGNSPNFCAADGENIWVGDGAGNIYQVQASTGKISAPLAGVAQDAGILTAVGYVYVASAASPGGLYLIDPTIPAVVASTTGIANGVSGIAFDGVAIWTANLDGSVSKIDPSSMTAYFTVSTGFIVPYGILYDGAHIWVTDFSAGSLLKLDSSGTILQTVTVGAEPEIPVFDGTNIWVPNSGGNSVTVVQASTGSIVATIHADANNLLNRPTAASFDGERVLITNVSGASVTLFKAADLSLIANVPTGLFSAPFGACSDGINFWIADSSGRLLRF